MAKDLGSLKPLFNTSGLVYKELGFRVKLPGLSEEEQLTLLASNGRLVKRPFVAGMGLVGFKEEQWEKLTR
jgi:arsenate reductase-like glutaredoxin family protein